MSTPVELSYIPSPTILNFINDESYIVGLAGPIGGGKTVGAIQKVFFNALRQPPGRDGVRRRRLGIVRSTHGNLVRTTVKSLRDWFPPAILDLRETPPMEGLITFPNLADGTSVELEILGLPLGHENALQDLKSLEVSDFWLQEGAELEYEVFSELLGRPGRYPPPNKGTPCLNPSIIIDFNLTDESHWLYKLLVSKTLTPTIKGLNGEDISPSIAYYEQPPAAICTNLDAALAGTEKPQYQLNPHAENLNNLPQGYYANALMTTDFVRIQRNILMRWTRQVLGKRIHQSFSREDHVSKIKTPTYSYLPCLIGMDTSGLHPAAVFAQIHAGTLVITDEVYGDGMAFLEFINTLVKPILATRYPGSQVIAICDPSNPRDSRSGITPVQTLIQAGIQAIPASTNKFSVRVDAGERLLKQRGGIVVDADCKMLIESLGEKYVRAKLKGSSSVVGAEIFADTAEDNQWTHIADAFQYLCLHLARGSEAFGTRTTQNIAVRVGMPRII